MKFLVFQYVPHEHPGILAGIAGAHQFVLWAFLFGVSICATALMPSLGYAVVGMVFVGFFSILLPSAGNTMIQLASASHMRGAVMSIWVMAIFGSTLIGAPFIGYIGEHFSARFALGVGGIAALIGGFIAAGRMLEIRELFAIPAWLSIRREETGTVDAKT